LKDLDGDLKKMAMSGTTLVLYSETTIATYCIDIKKLDNMREKIAEKMQDAIDEEAERLGIVDLD
jgi:hypothetical protein